MNSQKINWSYLKGLRQNFVENFPVGQKYWDSTENLESYHQTLGERIAWKWQSVFQELEARGIQINVQEITDYGCGSSIASRECLTFFSGIKKISLWDHSPKAVTFSQTKLKQSHPQVELIGLDSPPKSADCLVISHVLNELSAAAKNDLISLHKNSEIVLWIENGSLKNSRELSQIRNDLLQTGLFQVLAPCTHQNSCPLSGNSQETDWCHSFAATPSWVHQSAEWRVFAAELGIDLRSVPYSFLILARKDSSRIKQTNPDATMQHRLIGRPRHYKGYSKLLTCHGQQGVQELILEKRQAPALMKVLQKEKFEAPILSIELNNKKIVSGEMS